MALAVVTLAGAVAAQIGTSGTVRVIVAVVVSAGAGVIALMALFFLTGGSTTIIFAFLLAHAALFVALIARAALRVPTRTKG
ncbi:hypothetical protein [Paractinoplanes ferrugineus]|uniref:hypothetical protein n=1 Tax=Paractinoplanes ferrugineus TaxID=113564 RepID=UPI001945B584|nr:hypothetical protein [Actinoplanes ferrugineus]